LFHHLSYYAVKRFVREDSVAVGTVAEHLGNEGGQIGAHRRRLAALFCHPSLHRLE
jgi:hypothetical protein